MSRWRSSLLGIGAAAAVAGMYVMPAVGGNPRTPGTEVVKETSARPRIPQSNIPVRRAEVNQRENCWLFWCGSQVVLILGVGY